MKTKVLFSLMFLIVPMFVYVADTAADYEPHTQWSLPEGAKARLDKGSITGNIAYSPDGTRLAVASSIGVWIYDAQTGEELSLLAGEELSLLGHTYGVLSMSFSPDGTTLASGGGWNDNTVRLWDVATATHKATLTGHTDWVNSVSFSPDGTTLASGSRDNTVRLWDVATATHKATLTGHTDWVNSVSFSPDGTTLASGSRDNTVRLWDVATATHKATLTGHTDSVRSVSFSSDGTTLASGSGDDTVRLWDVATATHKATLTGHTSFVSSVSFSPDGTTLASGSGREVRLWDVATATHKATLTGHTDSVRSVSFSPDGTTLASGSGDDTVRLWDVATATHKATLTGHTSFVSSVSFSPDGTTLASGSGDGTVLLWTLAPKKNEQERLNADVNGDGIVNIQDLVLVASRFGETDENAADVNGDGEINIQDLVLVAGAFGDVAAAPTAHNLSILTPETVQQWLAEAEQMKLTDAISRRGIAVLAQLLAALIPKETALLANYPNPFNPETWIPYQLAAPADVTLTIYAADGQVVRTLTLGHQSAGMYQTRNRAAYWDGRNALGEPVASGLYFYTLTADDFTATRKMLIRK